MRTNLILVFAIVLSTLVFSACGGPATPNSNVSNTANANSNSLDTVKSTPEQTLNNAPTLSPVYKAYCAAWVKNDEAALRKVWSSETLKEFEEEMKASKEKSLMKFLSADKVSGDPCEAKNEKITGDTATATIISNKYPNGLQVVFIKENGEWKLTTKSPALDAVTKQAPPANAAK